MNFRPPDETYIFIENATFGPIVCQADCFPACTFNWEKDGVISNTSALSKQVFDGTDSGEYKCTATHERGFFAVKSVNLDAICK